MFSNRQILLIGSALAGISVLLGAFGAHALKPLLTQYQRIDTYELAVRYQFFHSLAILFLGIGADKIQSKLIHWAAVSFLGGIILFSGSLYCYATTNVTTFAMITPLGGLLFLAGWVSVFVAIVKSKIN